MQSRVHVLPRVYMHALEMIALTEKQQKVQVYKNNLVIRIGGWSKGTGGERRRGRPKLQWGIALKDT